jgi:hypothetical protein
MSFHDEPLVFDNGPFGMDVGEKHAGNDELFKQVATNKWLRKASGPTRILVQVKLKGNGSSEGQVEPYTMTHLHTEKGVTLTLKKPNEADTAQVKLTWGGVTEDELTIEPVDVVLKRRPLDPKSRRLDASNPALRIAKVEWHDGKSDRLISLDDGTGGLRHANVLVALF